jgi:hypothetical protein
MEGTTVGELAYISWPKYSAWDLIPVLGSVTGTGIGSITLRVLARQSDVRELYRWLLLWQ